MRRELPLNIINEAGAPGSCRKCGGSSRVCEGIRRELPLFFEMRWELPYEAGAPVFVEGIRRELPLVFKMRQELLGHVKMWRELPCLWGIGQGLPFNFKNEPGAPADPAANCNKQQTGSKARQHNTYSQASYGTGCAKLSREGFWVKFLAGGRHRELGKGQIHWVHTVLQAIPYELKFRIFSGRIHMAVTVRWGSLAFRLQFRAHHQSQIYKPGAGPRHRASPKYSKNSFFGVERTPDTALIWELPAKIFGSAFGGRELPQAGARELPHIFVAFPGAPRILGYPYLAEALWAHHPTRGLWPFGQRDGNLKRCRREIYEVDQISQSQKGSTIIQVDNAGLCKEKCEDGEVMNAQEPPNELVVHIPEFQVGVDAHHAQTDAVRREHATDAGLRGERCVIPILALDA
ncbi:hypothetical protein C8J57DRAFT_1235044 [Mycena rebaudengoi]|nr:hypothetical protein C8J57DRAFT_1235044 [Mycena rebaudengoi]